MSAPAMARSNFIDERIVIRVTGNFEEASRWSAGILTVASPGRCRQGCRRSSRLFFLESGAPKSRRAYAHRP